MESLGDLGKLLLERWPVAGVLFIVMVATATATYKVVRFGGRVTKLEEEAEEAATTRRAILDGLQKLVTAQALTQQQVETLTKNIDRLAEFHEESKKYNRGASEALMFMYDSGLLQKLAAGLK